MNFAQTANRTVLTFAAKVTGTATYTLFYTFQEAPTGDVNRWIAFSDMTDATSDVAFQSTYQIRAIKLSQTAGSGSVFLDVTLEFQS
jgi:hypothetical protein